MTPWQILDRLERELRRTPKGIRLVYEAAAEIRQLLDDANIGTYRFDSNGRSLTMEEAELDVRGTEEIRRVLDRACNEYGPQRWALDACETKIKELVEWYDD